MKLPEISSLTLEQRLKLLGGKDCWNTEDLGGLIPSVCVTDGPCGVRMPKQDERGEWRDLPSVAYPASVVLANSWDRKAVREVAEAIADDCIEKNADILLAPGVNIKRIPTCGRNFEYYSEDPYLAGELAYEYITGLQEKGIGTSLKHFCANNAEYDRQFQSSEIDERTLREIYLPAFERACMAKPWTVMCSYNLVNGKRMSEHVKLYDVLRKEFGFDGLIVSDWGAVHDPVASAKAGLNLEMGYNDQSVGKLKAAYDRGELTDEDINKNIEYLFDLLRKNEEAKKTRKITRTREQRLEVSERAAESGIVLLKNKDDILPLKGKKIAVTGYPAFQAYAGGGSAKVVPCEEIPSLHDCLKKEMPSAEIEFAAGTTGCHNAFTDFRGAVVKASDADVAVVCVGTGERIEYEGTDREHLRLTRYEEDLIHEVAAVNPETVVVVYAGSAIDMSDWIDEVKAVVFAGFGGERVQTAVAGVLSGRVNPSGKITETFPYAAEDVPAYNMPCNSHVCRYLEGLDVGYRYFKGENVLFPFGYGLSYSQFEYTDMKVVKKGEFDYEVKVTVKNTSDKDGAEVVQLYVKDRFASVYRPQAELKGFDKKLINAGKSETFTFALDKRSFAYYSVADDCWTVEKGKFDIVAASSVEDERLKETIEL